MSNVECKSKFFDSRRLTMCMSIIAALLMVMTAILPILYFTTPISGRNLVFTPMETGYPAIIWTADVYGNPKTDFAPGAVVYIHGIGFLDNHNVDVDITRPNSVVDSGSTMTDSAGSFVYAYDLNGIIGMYTVVASDGTNSAQTTFTDNHGAIWTTRNDCGDQTQDANQYNIGEDVYINGKGFDSSTTYDWSIKGKPGGASCDPGIVVASGTVPTDIDGAFCFNAYTVQAGDCGEYHVKVDTKGDNYRVIVQGPAVDIEKKVWDESSSSWVDSIVATVCNHLIFQITIYNDGDVDLTNVHVVDNLPGFLTYNYDASLAPSSANDHHMEWDLALLTIGSNQVITYSAHVDAVGEDDDVASVTTDESVSDEDMVHVIGEEAAQTCISFIQPLSNVDGDTSLWSTGDSMVVLPGAGHWDLLGGTADVDGYIDGQGILTHRGTRGLGVNGRENDEIDGYDRPERIEVTFDTPHILNYIEVRSLYGNEGPSGEPEEGDVDLYLGGGVTANYNLVGVENLGAGPGIVNVPVPGLLVDKVVFYVKQGEPYTPWSEFAVAKLCIEPCPCSDEVWVDDDADPGWYDCYHVASIQTGVDHVCECGNVYVADGTYTEQVVIDKSLKLLGDPGATIVAPDVRNTYTIAESSNTFDPIIFAYGGTLTGDHVSDTETISVEIDGFEIDGGNKASASPRFVAILYRNIQPGCTLSQISNNIIHSMYDADEEGNGPQTIGVVIYGDSEVTIETNEVSEFSRLGIGAIGNNGPNDPVVVIEDNTVTGNGFESGTNWWAENGIQISVGAGGDIIENIVSDCQVNNPSWVSCGIIVDDAANGVEILGNDVTLCDTGISIRSPSFDIIDGNTVSFCNWDALRLGWPTDHATVTDNILTDSLWGIYNADASDNLIEDNLIENNVYGIGIDGDSHNNLIRCNDILDNTEHGVYLQIYSATPTGNEIHCNNIVGNGLSGVENIDLPHDVDATCNWWGAHDGPSGFGPGSGDAVSDHVDYDPWIFVDADAGGPYYDEDEPYTIHFDGSGSSTSGCCGETVEYLWSFGDGGTSDLQNPTHTYSVPHKYTVTLTVTSTTSCGKIYSDSNTTTVNSHDDPPIVQLEYPRGGEELSGTVVIKWYAIDSEDWDSPDIWLYYSNDGGDSWVEIARNLQNTIGGGILDRGEYSWSTSSLSDGNYILKIDAYDAARNRASDGSKPFLIDNHGGSSNHPPDKPTKPSGPTSGSKVGEEFTYRSSTSDPDGDQVWYMWDWGDGKNSGWLGPYDSGAVCKASHTWTEKGDYNVKVKAKDQEGDASPWSDPLSISMPKNKAINTPFLRLLEQLMQRFPLIARLLQLPVFNRLLNFQ